MDNTDVCRKWFGSFCTKSKNIYYKKDIQLIKDIIVKWSGRSNISNLEIIEGAIDSGFRVNRNNTAFNIKLSESIPFIKNETYKFAEYYLYWHPNKDKLLKVHSFFMWEFNNQSRTFYETVVDAVLNPGWDEKEFKKQHPKTIIEE